MIDLTTLGSSDIVLTGVSATDLFIGTRQVSS
jgi:hypothetical protein